ncbi:helix-turn-helix transcriptional regulator [Rhodoplanes sp. SY1]|uniref:helix-turn-helix transcriptional regulator n=1 Tax=Rhodoplanes sp. SY1 TaxID=3166646 RepID=UPI0038B4801F
MTSTPVTLLTVHEARQRLRISRSSIYKLIGQGAFETVKLGKARRVVEASLDNYLRRQIEGGKAA